MSDLATSAERLLTQVRHWEQPRWSKPRSQRMYALVQLLADLAADAEGRERRAVPRVHDMVLPDQLRVVADDLLAAGAPAGVLAEAAEAVERVRHEL
jgi:hypothetical protein